MTEYKKGDIIRCKDKEDMIEKVMSLSKRGIDTDWPWIKEGEGEDRFTLKVLGVRKE